MKTIAVTEERDPSLLLFRKIILTSGPSAVVSFFFLKGFKMSKNSMKIYGDFIFKYIINRHRKHKVKCRTNHNFLPSYKYHW